MPRAFNWNLSLYKYRNTLKNLHYEIDAEKYPHFPYFTDGKSKQKYQISELKKDVGV